MSLENSLGLIPLKPFHALWRPPCLRDPELGGVMRDTLGTKTMRSEILTIHKDKLSSSHFGTWVCDLGVFWAFDIVLDWATNAIIVMLVEHFDGDFWRAWARTLSIATWIGNIVYDTKDPSVIGSKGNTRHTSVSVSDPKKIQLILLVRIRYCLYEVFNYSVGLPNPSFDFLTGKMQVRG